MSNPSTDGKSWPDRIWLQRDEQCVAEGCGPHGDDTTWCRDQIHATDVEYVRADLRSAPEPSAKRYAIYGRLIPLSENGVLEVGLDANIKAATHEVYLAQPPEPRVKRQRTGHPSCRKCHGSGWVYGTELDDASEDTRADTMTKYSCDMPECVALTKAADHE